MFVLPIYDVHMSFYLKGCFYGLTAKEAAERWGVSTRRVQVLCDQGKIPGVIRFGNTWAIPKDAVKPVDGRYKKEKK